MECKLLKYIKYSQEFKINFYKNIKPQIEKIDILKQFRKKIKKKFLLKKLKNVM